MDPFEKQCLDIHNEYRRAHGAEPLVWDKECSDAAKAWAKKMASTNNFQHSNTAMGENIASSKGVELTGLKATNMWYSEEKNYDYAQGNSKNGKEIGHFTQIVWKKSKKAGFAVAKAADGWMYACGNYLPPGNYAREYTANVEGLKGRVPNVPKEKTEEKETNQPSEEGSTSDDVVAKNIKKNTETKTETREDGVYEVKTVTTITVSTLKNGSTKTSTSTNTITTKLSDNTSKNEIEEEMENLGVGDKSYQSTADFSNDLIQNMNSQRKKYQARSLKMNDSMQKKAQSHAEKMLKDGSLSYHSSSYGQNIFMKQPRPTGAQVVELWMKEKEKYLGAKNNPSGSSFTQMLWRDSEEVGAGIASTEDGKSYIAVFFNPAGNVSGKFEDNVKI